MIINLILVFIAVYFAKKEYEDGRMKWAMFWTALIGWDLHALLSYL
jgi:hypothetical protein